MPSFAYQGDHGETRVFGLVFPRGVPVEVTDARVASKLANNADFSQVTEGVEVLPAEPRQKRKYTRRTEAT